MKKILFSIIISSVSLSSLAGGVFNMQIPQPDFISNDWDGDGIINSLDDNDDNDEYLDIDDSTPFGKIGNNITITRECFEKYQRTIEGVVVTTGLNAVNKYPTYNSFIWDGTAINYYESDKTNDTYLHDGYLYSIGEFINYGKDNNYQVYEICRIKN